VWRWRGAFAVADDVADVADVGVDAIVESPLSRTFWLDTFVILFYCNGMQCNAIIE
jgi:hypothetical protein